GRRAATMTARDRSRSSAHYAASWQTASDLHTSQIPQTTRFGGWISPRSTSGKGGGFDVRRFGQAGRQSMGPISKEGLGDRGAPERITRARKERRTRRV